MMDILGLPKRMFDQLGQMNTQAPKAVDNDTTVEIKNSAAMSAMGERINAVAARFDVKHLPISEVIPLQQALTDTGLVGSSQVRAQGLLTQLAYQHQKTGPMDLEQALEDHLTGLQEKPAVLADYQEGKHVLNLVRNLDSARAHASVA